MEQKNILNQLSPQLRNMPINNAVRIASACLLRSDAKSFGDTATIGDVVRIITENTCQGCGYMCYEDDGKCFECEAEKAALSRERGRVNLIDSISIKINLRPEKASVLLKV